MASVEFLGEGASLARPLDILDAVENGPFIPKIAGTGDSLIPKPRSDWVSNCKTTKEMWDTLQQTHEGTNDVKRARTNTLLHEYELFSMKKDESINDMHTRFTHIVNNLNALESKDLSSLSIATLYGKLREHEMELHRLSEAEQTDRKRKGLSLKAQTHQSKSEQESCSDESSSHIKSECYKLQNKNRTAKTKDSESESEVCLTSNRHSWYLDSGCSMHMTGDKSKFLSLTLKEGGFVKYGDNNKGKISGVGDIGNESTAVIKNVLYVEGLKHNLLSISQLCDKGFQETPLSLGLARNKPALHYQQLKLSTLQLEAAVHRSFG
ncbi:uncharacterized protein [Cicer arietinum]|uniref:uncharacterized protein n=1 Tax=Cicer arietinum TaxID=3827 RepID=UPI003CC5622F